MRRKPNSQGGSNNGGFNNQQRKQRFQQGGGGGHNNGRPRKNYSAMREKYLTQARDALAAGDRVLAENYYQHADHCYRMMVEEGYQFRNTYNQQQEQHHSEPAHGNADEAASNDSADEPAAATGSQLPAFLTAGFDGAQAQSPSEPVAATSWEE